VNVGCVPKKIMFNLASFLEEAEVMRGYGVHNTDKLKLDFPAFKAKRDAYVHKLNGIYRSNL
jgi:glutathione reductase (NADPH)